MSEESLDVSKTKKEDCGDGVYSVLFPLDDRDYLAERKNGDWYLSHEGKSYPIKPSQYFHPIKFFPNRDYA